MNNEYEGVFTENNDRHKCTLDDVHKNYEEYLEIEQNSYQKSDFSKTLTSRLRKYNLDDQIKRVNINNTHDGNEKNNFNKGYRFSNVAAEALGLFLGCSENKYKKENIDPRILNPFAYEGLLQKQTLSDLKTHVEKLEIYVLETYIFSEVFAYIPAKSWSELKERYDKEWRSSEDFADIENYILYLMEKYDGYMNENYDRLCENARKHNKIKDGVFECFSRNTKLNISEIILLNKKIDIAIKLKNVFNRIITALFCQDNFSFKVANNLLERLYASLGESFIINEVDKVNEKAEKLKYDPKIIEAHADYGEALSKQSDKLALEYIKYYKTVFDGIDTMNPEPKDKVFNSADVIIAAWLAEVLEVENVIDNIPADDLAKKLTDESFKSIANDEVYEFNRQVSRKSLKNDSNTVEHNIFTEYILRMIELMVKDFFEIIQNVGTCNANASAQMDELHKKYKIKTGEYISNLSEVEKAIFIMYIIPTYEELKTKNNKDEVKERIQNHIKQILSSKIEENSKLVEEDSLNLDESLDLLMFKPFIQYHKLDMEELKKRIENSPLNNKAEEKNKD